MVWPVGVGHIALASTDSTNTEGLRRAASLYRPTWISAAEQTSGRGRRAQYWASPPGNLYATLVMRVDDPPQTVALRSFVAALALRDALCAQDVPPAALTLKWPNDVLLNGGKVAGILLEAQAGPAGRVLAIGIGVNLANHPPQAPGAALPPVSFASEMGWQPDPFDFLCHLAGAFEAWENIFCTKGFAPIRSAWLAHAARLGQQIRARTGDLVREGRFDTIDHNGNLILVMATGTVAIPAAEVFF